MEQGAPSRAQEPQTRGPAHGGALPSLPKALSQCHIPEREGHQAGEGRVDRTLPKWPASPGKVPLSGLVPRTMSGGCIPGRAGSVPGARLQLLVIHLLGQDRSKLRSTQRRANRPPAARLHAGSTGASSPFFCLPPPSHLLPLGPSCLPHPPTPRACSPSSAPGPTQASPGCKAKLAASRGRRRAFMVAGSGEQSLGGFKRSAGRAGSAAHSQHRWSRPQGGADPQCLPGCTLPGLLSVSGRQSLLGNGGPFLSHPRRRPAGSFSSLAERAVP